MAEDKPATVVELLKLLAAADNKVATKRGELKGAEEEYEAVADRIFRLMDEQGTDAIRNKQVGLQVSISETDVDIIEDYAKFSAFLLRHKLLHLVQRRLSPVAVREWQVANPKKKIPGLGVFHKRRLHVTKYSD